MDNDSTENKHPETKIMETIIKVGISCEHFEIYIELTILHQARVVTPNCNSMTSGIQLHQASIRRNHIDVLSFQET